MENTNWVTAILDHGLDRAFPNLYNVSINPPNNDNSLTSMFRNVKYYAEKISFEPGFSFDTRYSDALKQFFIINATRIKTVSITFRETSLYGVIKGIKTWMNKIYDPDKNRFLQFNPEGEIQVDLDPIMEGTTTAGYILFTGAYPVNLKYPSYDWADGNPIKVECTFNCQNTKFQIPNGGII
jgi:hypothetical protein